MKIERKLYNKYLEKTGMSEDEYAHFCAPYLAACNELAQTVLEYKDRRQELQAQLLRAAVRQEHSSGGELIHRGFYCPSPVFDIIVGNVSRGRRCKWDNPKAIYTHSFDADSRHIASHNVQTGAVEYILWDGISSLGIQFRGDSPETVARCMYDGQGKIISYEFLLHAFGSVHEYRRELYSYSEKELLVERLKLNPSVTPPLVEIDKYRFSVENGYLKDYTVEDRYYKVSKKRKIY